MSTTAPSSSSRLSLSSCNDDIIDYALEGVFAAFDRELALRRLDTMDVPMSTKLAMLTIKRIVAWSVLKHDGELPVNGDGNLIPDKALEQLTADPEPAPVMIDPWARGSVPTRKATANDVNYTRTEEGRQSTMSVSSFGRSSKASSKPSKRGGGSSVAGSKIGSNGRPGTSHEDDEDPSGQIIELDEADADFANLSATDHMFDLLQRQKRHASNELSNKGSDVIDEFDLIQENIGKATKDFKKGKKFLIDREGNVMPIVPTRPESLPAFNTQPRVQIGGPVTLDEKGNNSNNNNNNNNNNNSKGKGNAEGGGGDGKQGEKTTTTTTTRKKNVIKVAGARGVDESLFQASHTLANTLSGADNIPAINPGVTIRGGDEVRRGPPVPNDPAKPSRKQYTSNQLSMSRSSIGGGLLLEVQNLPVAAQLVVVDHVY